MATARTVTWKSTSMRNQCDGCQAGIPLENGNRHRMGKPGGYPDYMSCTRKLYQLPDVDTLSNIIRKVDGNHSLGAGALAEAILQELNGAE